MAQCHHLLPRSPCLLSVFCYLPRKLLRLRTVHFLREQAFIVAPVSLRTIRHPHCGPSLATAAWPTPRAQQGPQCDRAAGHRPATPRCSARPAGESLAARRAGARRLFALVFACMLRGERPRVAALHRIAPPPDGVFAPPVATGPHAKPVPDAMPAEPELSLNKRPSRHRRPRGTGGGANMGRERGGLGPTDGLWLAKPTTKAAKALKGATPSLSQNGHGRNTGATGTMCYN